ncbi:MAG: hypothetical protein AB1728_13580 [Bacteroidota bacterium]
MKTKIFFLLLIISIPFFLPAQTTQKNTQLPKAFFQQLNKVSASFALPKDFEIVPIRQNDDVAYDFAMKSTEKKIEIRYKFFDETSEQNVYMVLVTMCLNINGGEVPQIGSYNPEDVQGEFNADFGYTCAVQANSEFSDGYSKCMISSITRIKKGTVYKFFLFDDINVVQEHMFRDDVFHALKFKK